MSRIQNVAVIGGTGQIGRAIVDALLEANFCVTIVTRDASATKLSPAKAKLVVSSYTYDSLVELFAGHDVVVSTVAAGPAIAAQKVMIDAAIQAGVSRFIPSEYGSSSLEVPLEDFRRLMQPKTQIITYLREVAASNSKFTWSCLSGGALFDVGLRSGAWGFSLPKRTATIFDTGKARFDSTTLPVMAMSVVSVLRNPMQTANQYLLIGSFTVMQRDILAALEEVTGSKWTVSYCDSEDTRQTGWKLVQAGNPQEGIPKVIQGSLFNDNNDLAIDKERFANVLLNLPEVDMGEYVKSLVAV